jgi:hypothetical protein
LSENDAATDATSPEALSKALKSIPTDPATGNHDNFASGGEILNLAPVDKMVKNLKRNIALHDESLKALPEESVEPAFLSLSPLSPSSPSPGPKADKNRLVTPSTPSPGPKKKKNPPTTQSITSPDPKADKS